jgi:hypothetical protein
MAESLLAYGKEITRLQWIADSLATEEKSLETMLDSVTVKPSVDELTAKADQLKLLLPDVQNRLNTVKDSLDAWKVNAEMLLTEIVSSTSLADVLLNEVSEVYTGIPSLAAEEEDLLRFDLQGRPVDKRYHGVVIVRYPDGSSSTVFQK